MISRFRNDFVLSTIGVVVMAVAVVLAALTSSASTTDPDEALASEDAVLSLAQGNDLQRKWASDTEFHTQAPTKPHAKAKAEAKKAAPKQPAPRAQRAERPRPSICSGVHSAARVARLSPEQSANAATIISVARERGLPERAAVIALATAMQESKLHNIDYGDRDSLGLFQQRPSQGWGSPAQVTDPRYAAGKFYDGLVGVKNWKSRPLTQSAQAVQRSAYPDRYAQWEGVATTLSRHLNGATPPGTHC